MFAPVPTLNAQRPRPHKAGLCLLRSELTTQLCNRINQVARMNRSDLAGDG